MRQATTITRPKVEINEATHKYSVGGSPVDWPSVTEVLDFTVDKSKFLVPWASNQSLNLVREELTRRMGKEVEISQEFINNLITESKKKPEQAKREGASKGTIFHDLAVKILKNEPYEIAPEMKNAIDNFGLYLKTKKVKLLLSEVPVASIECEYTGKFDSIVETSEGIELWDFKTTNKNDRNALYPGTGIYNKDAFQIGGYIKAIKETLGTSVFKGRLVWINKNDMEFADFVIQDLKLATDGFLRALAWFKIHKTKMLLAYQHFKFDI